MNNDYLTIDSLNAAMKMMLAQMQDERIAIQPTQLIVPPRTIIDYARAGLAFPLLEPRSKTMDTAKNLSNNPHFKLSERARVRLRTKKEAKRRKLRAALRHSFNSRP